MLAIRGLLVVLVLIVCWQLFVIALKLPPYILPGPYQVLVSIIENKGVLFSNAQPTIAEILLGLSGGVMLGILVALFMTDFRLIRFWLLPVILLSQAVPTFAFAPLLVLWFGYGMLSKVITIILMLFFPVANSFYEGMSRTRGEWLDMAKIMGATKTNLLLKIRFRAALPNLADGVKIATVLAPLGAVVSEWIGASKGLGFLMLNANARLEIDLMFASLVFIMAISLLLYAVVNSLIKLLFVHYQVK